MRKEFTAAFENNSAQIGFSYSLVSGSRTLIKQDSPFDFDYDSDPDSEGAEKDEDGVPRVRVHPNGDSLIFSMTIQMEVNDEYLHQPLRLLFSLNYFMETFGLSSNQLQMEAERRSSSIDPDRNDHLRGYIGVDEEEFRVRQLMEFNRFRPTKVPPKEAELSIEVVKPLTITSICEEVSPSCAMLTLNIRNSYPGATISLQRVTIHANETIKGATLLRSDPVPETEGMATNDEESTSRHSRYSSTEGGADEGRALMNIQDDLLNGGKGEGQGEQLLEVDLSDDGEDGGEEMGSNGDRNQDKCSVADAVVSKEGENGGALPGKGAPGEEAWAVGEAAPEAGTGTEAGDSALDAESAYIMQVRGRPLDVSALFTFTALDRLSAAGEDSPVRVVPPGEICTVRYRVEPREERGTRPFLHSSLLVGDFFSPLSIVWSAGGTGSEVSASSLARAGTSVGKYVAYWSIGKRWANLCCFEEVSMPAVHGGTADSVASSRAGTPAKARPVPASPGAHLCLGNQIGEGSPMRSPYMGYAAGIVPGTGTGAGAGAIPLSTQDAVTITVTTPSRRQGQGEGRATMGSSDREGAFVLTMRGPSHVDLLSAFEVQLEVANKSARAMSNLSLQVNSSGAEGQVEVPYVVHESCTTFCEVLPPGHSLKHTLHVYPLVAGPLNLNSLTLVERSSGMWDSGQEQEVEARYEFLQFFSCFVSSMGGCDRKM